MGDKMKRILLLLMIALLAIAMIYGCGKKEADSPDKVPVEVKEAETMDTTRMDSAVMDSAALDTVVESTTM